MRNYFLNCALANLLIIFSANASDTDIIDSKPVGGTNGRLVTEIPYKLLSKSSNKYLDGRRPNDDQHAIVTSINIIGGSDYAKWNFIPLNYQLQASIDNMSYTGDVQAILQANMRPDYSGMDKVVIGNENLNATISDTYTTSVEDNFTWSLNEKLGITLSSEVSVQGDVPLIGSASTTESLSLTAEIESGQSFSHTKTSSYSSQISFSPTQIGTYQIGELVYVTNDVKIPFTAKVTLQGNLSDGKRFNAAALEALLRYEEYKSNISDNKKKTITFRGSDCISFIVSGTLQASYGVNSEKRISKIA